MIFDDLTVQNVTLSVSSYCTVERYTAYIVGDILFLSCIFNFSSTGSSKSIATISTTRTFKKDYVDAPACSWSGMSTDVCVYKTNKKIEAQKIDNTDSYALNMFIPLV